MPNKNLHKSSFYFVFILFILCNSIRAQSSFEINLGSVRPITEYAENLSQGGMFDVGAEFQVSLPQLFSQSEAYFPLSVGMKISYNYYRIHKEKWGDVLVDYIELSDEIIIPYPVHEFKYTLRSHCLNTHPFIELSTPKTKNIVLFARYYAGPTFTWTSSKIRLAHYDNNKVKKLRLRNTYSKKPSLDHGFKVGLAFDLNINEITTPTKLVISYTYMYGGEMEYLGKNSFKSYDRESRTAEYEFKSSATDRYIVSIGLMRVF